MKSEIQQYYDFWFGMNAIYEKWAKNKGLTANALFILYVVHEYPGQCTQSLLCKKLLLSKQTVNSILERFTKDGFIQKVLVPCDKRHKTIHFTEKGRQYAEKILTELYLFEKQALSNMSMAQRTAMIETSHVFLAQLQRAFH